VAPVGGGIYNSSITLTIQRVPRQNTAPRKGGGGLRNDFGSVTIQARRISSNSADASGGIDNNNGALTIINSTIFWHQERLLNDTWRARGRPSAIHYQPIWQCASHAQ